MVIQRKFQWQLLIRCQDDRMFAFAKGAQVHTSLQECLDDYDSYCSGDRDNPDAPMHLAIFICH